MHPLKMSAMSNILVQIHVHGTYFGPKVCMVYIWPKCVHGPLFCPNVLQGSIILVQMCTWSIILAQNE